MFSTDFILFRMGGMGVSLLELLSVVTGLTCVFLAGRGKSINFWFGYVYCFLLFALFMQKHLYSSMILQPISLIINIIGHYKWTHPKAGEENKDKELKVTRMSNPV
ncbi:MAG: nicotinamide riboside transporter PnuC, partial [Bacteroidales bacterium]|nr:nicotinamide riboside transporter PnuC [Bacteroidales bacterium]